MMRHAGRGNAAPANSVSPRLIWVGVPADTRSILPRAIAVWLSLPA
jgi:hypothetical protein